MTHLPGHQRNILRKHTGPANDDEAGLIVGSFTESLVDPWDRAGWAPTAWERPWVGTRGSLRLDANPAMTGGLNYEGGPLGDPWESEQWEPSAYDQPSRISRALGSMRDGSPAMLGALDPDVLDHFSGPKSDPWSLASKFAPRRYERPWVKSAMGTRGDANPAMVGGYDDDEYESGALPGRKRQARAVLKAAKGLAKWSERNRIPVGKAFLGTGDANAAGWVLHLPSENDRIQAIQQAKKLSVVHRTFHNIKGSSMGTGWFLVYFTDDPAAELAVAPDETGDETTAGIEDNEVGFLKKLFGPRPKAIRRKIARLEKRLAKLKAKLEEMGEDVDEDDEGGFDVEGFEVGRFGRGMRGGFGRGMRMQRRAQFAQQHPGFAQQLAQRPGAAARFYSGAPMPGMRRRRMRRQGFGQQQPGISPMPTITASPFSAQPMTPVLSAPAITAPSVLSSPRVTQPFSLAGGSPVMLTQGVHPFV